MLDEILLQLSVSKLGAGQAMTLGFLRLQLGTGRRAGRGVWDLEGPHREGTWPYKLPWSSLCL